MPEKDPTPEPSREIQNSIGEFILYANRIVTMWLDFAENQAKRRKQIFLNNWLEKLGNSRACPVRSFNPLMTINEVQRTQDSAESSKGVP